LCRSNRTIQHCRMSTYASPRTRQESDAAGRCRRCTQPEQPNGTALQANSLTNEIKANFFPFPGREPFQPISVHRGKFSASLKHTAGGLRCAVGAEQRRAAAAGCGIAAAAAGAGWCAVRMREEMGGGELGCGSGGGAAPGVAGTARHAASGCAAVVCCCSCSVGGAVGPLFLEVGVFHGRSSSLPLQAASRAPGAPRPHPSSPGPAWAWGLACGVKHHGGLGRLVKWTSAHANTAVHM
jgi:hypothetical protein